MAQLTIKTCPICGSSRIKRVSQSLTRSFNNRRYVVPDVTFHHCPYCGENLFDAAATDKIQAHSPAFARSAGAKRIRKTG